MNEHFKPSLSLIAKSIVILLMSLQFSASAIAAQSVKVKISIINPTVGELNEKEAETETNIIENITRGNLQQQSGKTIKGKVVV